MLESDRLGFENPNHTNIDNSKYLNITNESNNTNQNLTDGSTMYDLQPNFNSKYILQEYKWLSLINSKYHSASIFLALEQGWVSMGLLKKIHPICWTNYIKVLVNNNILVKTNLSKKEKSDLYYINGIGQKVNNIKFYKLSKRAFLFFIQNNIFNCIRDKVDSKYISEQISELKKNIEVSKEKSLKKEKREKLQLIIKMKNQGIELNSVDLKSYQLWRGEK